MFINKIHKFEYDNSLLNFEVRKVKVWQYLRADIINNILKKKGEIFQAIDDKKDHTSFSFKNKLIYIYKLFRNAMFYNPFFCFKTIDKIVFMHPRKLYYKDKFIDMYTYTFENDKNALIIDTSMDENYRTKHYRNSFIIVCMYLLRKFYREKLSSKDHKSVVEVENKIKDKLEIDISLTDMFDKYSKTFKAFYLIYYLLFKIKKPREIYLVVNYGLAPLIKAAKDLNIKVVEIQHGIIVKHHSGYCYPYNSGLEYFPDELYVFGEYFKNMDFLPLSQDKIKVFFYKYFFEKYAELNIQNKVIEKKKKILIISDANDAGGMYQTFLEHNFDLFQNYDIIYKLHPLEVFTKSYEKCHNLKKLLKYENFSLEKKQEALHLLLKECEYCISYKSTVIFEALELGCNVIVPKLPGWEDLEQLAKYVNFVDLDEKIVFKMSVKSSKGFFIKSFGEDNFTTL